MIDVGSRLQLFVDEHLIEDMNGGASLRLHRPVSRGTVLTLERPWEGALCGYPAIVPFEDGWRLYYRGWPEDSETSCVCVVKSKDGIEWTRPELGILEYGGSSANNVILSDETMPGDRGAHNFCPMLDTREGVPQDERYKALAYGPRVSDRLRSLCAFASGDGLRWSALNDGEPVFRAKHWRVMLDSQNVGFWDEVAGEYRLYGRNWIGAVRHIFLSRSDDFVNWSEPQSLDFGDAPLEDLYTNAIVPYFRAPQMLIGFPKRFIPHRQSIDDWPGGGLSEGVFICSRDGLRWHRHLEAFLRPGLGEDRWTERSYMIARGIIPTSESEISVYWMEDYRRPRPRIVRGTVRTDGFVSVNAPHSGGEFVTPPLTFQGARLILNASTSAAGSIRVEMQDERGRPLPGMSLADCPEIYGDGLELEVGWPKTTRLPRWNGVPVRLRFVIRDADLYSLRFCEEDGDGGTGH